MATTLLEAVRLELRTRHYSRRTEQAYIAWIRRYVRHYRGRHPRELDEPEVRAYLGHLATERKVSASTQSQALAAIQFLYRDVLRRPIGFVTGVPRAKRRERLPVVLTRSEVRALIEQLNGAKRIMALLLYGAGLRLNECLSLRVKDIDFEMRQIVVRGGKGDKDRVTMLPASVEVALLGQLEKVRALHARDVAAGGGDVELPGALARASFPRRRATGGGSGSFQRQPAIATRRRAPCADTTRTSPCCSVRCTRPASVRC